MHWIALVEHPDHVCCRYRVRAFQDDLTRAGHTLELLPYPKNAWSWFRLGRDLRHADVVVVQRKLPPTIYLNRLRRASRYLIFDLDDAVFLRDSYSKHGINSKSRWRRFQAMTRTADAVFAGNEFLADQAQLACAQDKVLVVPTCVDPSRYEVARHDCPLGAELVWLGSSSTLQGLERIRPLLETIGIRHPDVALNLVCDRFLRFHPLRVRDCPWSAATEANELAKSDIGIVWMPDDDWSRGKCGLKVLQYMAAGLPVIGNPVGVHFDMIEDGVNGYLAETEDDWIDAIGRLKSDPDLRRRMGAAGRTKVEREYAPDVGVSHWLGIAERRYANRAG